MATRKTAAPTKTTTRQSKVVQPPRSKAGKAAAGKAAQKGRTATKTTTRGKGATKPATRAAAKPRGGKKSPATKQVRVKVLSVVLTNGQTMNIREFVSCASEGGSLVVTVPPKEKVRGRPLDNSTLFIPLTRVMTAQIQTVLVDAIPA